jgi:hypothetical protein
MPEGLGVTVKHAINAVMADACQQMPVCLRLLKRIKDVELILRSTNFFLHAGRNGPIAQQLR